MSVLFKRLIHLKKKLLDFEKHTFLRILVCSSNNIKLCGFVTSQDILFHGVHTIIGRYMTGNSAPPPPPPSYTLLSACSASSFSGMSSGSFICFLHLHVNWC